MNDDYFPSNPFRRDPRPARHEEGNDMHIFRNDHAQFFETELFMADEGIDRVGSVIVDGEISWTTITALDGVNEVVDHDLDIHDLQLRDCSVAVYDFDDRFLINLSLVEVTGPDMDDFTFDTDGLGPHATAIANRLRANEFFRARVWEEATEGSAS